MNKITQPKPYIEAKKAVVCPVCNGKGEVPVGFYEPTFGTSDEKCRSCRGKGYIII